MLWSCSDPQPEVFYRFGKSFFIIFPENGLKMGHNRTEMGTVTGYSANTSINALKDTMFPRMAPMCIKSGRKRHNAPSSGT